MLFLIFGSGSKEKTINTFGHLYCKSCGNTVPLILTKFYDYFHLFYIPFFRYHIVYHACCPHCQAVYLLNHNTAKRVKQFPQTTLDPSELQMISRGKKRCTQCGMLVEFDMRYCPQCGKNHI